jgi:tRNA(Ile)-lysidine synthetase-like protein
VLAAAAQLEEDRRAWDAVLELLPGLDIRSETDGGSVAVAPFAGYDSAVGPVVLRVWGRRLDCVLSRDHARRVAGFLRQAASGTRMEVGNGWTVEVVFDRAHLRHAAAGEAAGAGAGAETAMLIEGEAGDGELGRWRLFWRHENAPPLQERDALTAWFIPQALLVRPWSEGDRVFPLGGRGRRLVVRCFQDAKVPRQQRKAWPMVTNAAGEIMWVPGVCRSNQMVPPAGVEALRVDAQVV